MIYEFFEKFLHQKTTSAERWAQFLETHALQKKSPLWMGGCEECSTCKETGTRTPPSTPMISNNLWQPLTASDTQTQNKSSNLTSRGFQKHITCLDSVHFQIWPFTTSHELKWPRILKNPKDPFLAWSQLSKNILSEKSQKSHFSNPFSSTTSTGWNGPKPNAPSVHIPHPSSLTPSLIPQFSCFLCFKLVMPHASLLTPHSSLLIPHSSFLSFLVLVV